MKDLKPDFYLSSTEGHIVGEPRMCFIQRQVRYANRNDCLIVSVSPPIDGHRYGCGEINKVVIATRFKGDTLSPPNRWPLEVHVLRFLVVDAVERATYDVGELVNFAWGEIYRNKDEIPLIDVNHFGD